MAETLTCLEHQIIPIRPSRQAGEWALSIAQAKQLGRLKGIPLDAFRWGHQSVQWRQFCGVVQLDGLTLEILPKIYGKESDVGACRSTLVKMLRKVRLMKVHRGAGANIHVQDHSLLDIFILEFCRLVREQLVMGKPRDYCQREDNLRVVKGKLLIEEQFRHNLCHRERLYCQYDEFSEDILINQIVKFTLKLLLLRSRSSVAKKSITELLMQHDAIEDRTVSIADVDTVQINRANERYAQVLVWCRLFIGGQSPDVTAGRNTLLSILFDMNLLFERWLAAELRPIARHAGFSVKEQSPRKYLAYRTDPDRPVFQTRPDISLIDSEGRVVVIIDAKWKMLDGTDTKLGISQQDLYQLAAYANLYRLSDVALVYPRQSGLAPEYSLTLPGSQTLSVTIICLDIDQALARHKIVFEGIWDRMGCCYEDFRECI